MRIEKEKPNTQVITMEEEYQIPGTDIILEAGDKIEVPLEEENLEESHLDPIKDKFAVSLMQAYNERGLGYVQEEIGDLLVYTRSKMFNSGVQSELVDYIDNLMDLVY